jgi:hypothetical protein
MFNAWEQSMTQLYIQLSNFVNKPFFSNNRLLASASFISCRKDLHWYRFDTIPSKYVFDRRLLLKEEHIMKNLTEMAMRNPIFVLQKYA